MSKAKPRQWSMEQMRKDGYITGITEFFNSHTKRRKDLFGFIDFIAVGSGRCVGVQCCARSSIGSHRRKILEECGEAAFEWLRSGNEIQIHGWDRIDEPLKTKEGHRVRRRLKVESITINMLDISRDTC